MKLAWTTTVLTACLVLPIAPALGDDAADAKATVRAMLTDFHRAAAEGDGDRYFGHLAPDAIVLGTSRDERFSFEEFQALVKPHFAQGARWETVVTEQNVYLSHDEKLAWFDERLQREGLSEMRGSGVARRTDDGWKIVQYNTSFPIPNELARELPELIRRLSTKE